MFGWFKLSTTGDACAADCPRRKRTTITGAGVISCPSDAIVKCCKANRQLDALKQIHDRRNDK